MKLIQTLFILLVIANQGYAQIYGNSELKTITKSFKKIKNIDIQFNADITLDYNLEENLTITADENILDFIGIKFKNGTLVLDQIKWIEPSQLPKIVLGTPNIVSVYQGTHSATSIINVKGEKLNLSGNVGKIKARGEIGQLTVRTTGTEIDLSKLDIGKAYVDIDDDSKVILNKVGELEKSISDDARLVLLSEVKGKQGVTYPLTKDIKAETDIRWIEFKIKNNSWKRNHFVVVGPKKDGSKFSYGFSLMPHVTKKEKWSTGTKVYKENRRTGKKLLVTIIAENEGQTVNLFE